MPGETARVFGARLWREPERVFPPGIQAKDRAHGGLHVIDRAGARGASGAALFLREVDGKAVGVLVLDPRFGELRIGPIVETGHVPAKHVIFRFTVDHPLRGKQPHAAGLGKAGDNAVAAEIIGQFRHRAEKHIGVGRPDHRAVDDPFDACLRDGGNAGDGVHHVFFDPVKVIGEKIMGKIGGRAGFGPKPDITFIRADQQALAFLAQVVFAIAVADRWQAAVKRGDLCHGFGDEILVFCGLQGQVDPGHGGDFAAPQTGRVDDPFGMDIAPRGADDPAAIGLRLCPRDGGEAVDLRAPLPRACGIGLGHARGIDIAAIGFEHHAADAGKVDHRVQRLRLLQGQGVKVHPV